MYHIVSAAFSSAKFINLLDKGGDVLVEIVFGECILWSSFNVDDPHKRTKLYDMGGIWISPAGKDINGNVTVS
jgi:hypothetical protein